MFLKFLRETSLNTMRIFLHGRPIEGFVSKVIADPFKARSDVRLQEQYEFYRKNRHLLLLNKSQRIVLNFILTRDYNILVNELPHFYYLTVKYGCPVYCIPSLTGMNPKDYKSGDFIVDKGGLCVESKSYVLLRQEKLSDIRAQFSLNSLNSILHFNIFYGSLNSDLVLADCLQVLKELRFQQNNINLMSLTEFKLYHTEEHLIKFFKTYNMSWFLYKEIQYSHISLQLNKIISHTENKDAIALCYKYLYALEAEKKNLSFSGSKKQNKTQFIEDFNLSQVDETYYNNICDSEAPEDFMPDVNDWFSED